MKNHEKIPEDKTKTQKRRYLTELESIIGESNVQLEGDNLAKELDRISASNGKVPAELKLEGNSSLLFKNKLENLGKYEDKAYQYLRQRELTNLEPLLKQKPQLLDAHIGPEQQCLLWHAVLDCNYPAVYALLRNHSASPDGIEDKESPLALALSKYDSKNPDSFAIIEQLVKNGADLKKPLDSSGNTPWSRASVNAANGDDKLFTLFIETQHQKEEYTKSSQSTSNN